ncbi:MAG TPA: argininosuccinate synthase domain-containing protein [Thermoanaerobaculia bacterium]
MKRRTPVVCLAFSGGLDTTYCALLLREEGALVHAVTVDTGGFSSRERALIARRARAAGARHVWIDGRRRVFRDYALPLLYGNVLRGGVYPLSVAAERAVQAEEIARHARRVGARTIAHGSTAAGNDQFRFDAALRVLAPALEVRAPIRDSGVSREEEAAYCAARGIAIPPRTTTYSVNEGLWGTTIGGGETHDPWALPPESLFPGNTLERAASTLKMAGRLDDAFHVCEILLSNSDTANEYLALSLVIAAEVKTIRADYPAAFSLLARLRELLNVFELPSAAAHLQACVGEILRQTGDCESAIDALVASHAAFAHLEMAGVAARVQLLIGEALLTTGRLQEASSELSAAVTTFREQEMIELGPATALLNECNRRIQAGRGT